MGNPKSGKKETCGSAAAADAAAGLRSAADAEHLGGALRARPLHGLLAILESDALRVVHLPGCLALHAVGFHHGRTSYRRDARKGPARPLTYERSSRVLVPSFARPPLNIPAARFLTPWDRPRKPPRAIQPPAYAGEGCARESWGARRAAAKRGR